LVWISILKKVCFLKKWRVSHLSYIIVYNSFQMRSSHFLEGSKRNYYMWRNNYTLCLSCKIPFYWLKRFRIRQKLPKFFFLILQNVFSLMQLAKNSTGSNHNFVNKKLISQSGIGAIHAIWCDVWDHYNLFFSSYYVWKILKLWVDGYK